MLTYKLYVSPFFRIPFPLQQNVKETVSFCCLLANNNKKIAPMTFKNDIKIMYNLMIIFV